MEIERGAEVDREWQPFRKVRGFTGHVHVPALWLDRQIEPRGRGKLAGPDTCGEDDAPGIDAPARGLNAGDAAALDDDPLHRTRLFYARPELSRPPRAALHHEVGCDDARHSIEHRAAEIIDGDLGHDLVYLLRTQHPRRGLCGRVVREVSLEALHVTGLVKEEEIAVEAEVELLAHLLLEALQPSNRFGSDANVQLVGEQRADTTGAPSCGAG